MKKLIYTLSFITVLGLTSNAQQPQSIKQTDPKKEATPAPAVKPEQAAPSSEPKSRMAITQKGVPASKAKEKESKDMKATEAKPATTEKH